MTFSEAGSGPTSGAIAGVDQKAADQIVESSIAAGVNFIDTADVYWFGESERLLGQALKNLDVPRKDVVLATKVSREMGDKPNDRGASRGHIMFRRSKP
jgi:aryl-alcohol dehydrogenase-like predicted oxidoreductase